MAETEPVPNFYGGFIGMGTVKGYGYGRQTASGALNVGVRNLDASLDAPPPDDEAITNAFKNWERFIPSLKGTRIVRTWAGYTVWTPDQHPIIGEIGGLPGVIVATGFCGQGFGASAGVGMVLKELILDQTPSVDLAPFSPDRFLA